jgi:hypothetical protein
MIRSKRIIGYLCFLCFFIAELGRAQIVDPVKIAFRDFEYEKVIELTDQLLVNGDSLDQQTIIELLKMKAIAQYSLDQEVEAEKVFLQILDIDLNFNLNEQETSPKIIDFFEKIKSSYKPKPEPAVSDIKPEADSTVYVYRSAFGRSIIFPGWGHLYLKQKRKAMLLGIPAGVSLVSGVYYSFLTAKREREYLNATRSRAIEENYEAYNTVYKTRNIVLVAYAVIWIYSQFDLIKNGEEYIGHRQQISLYPLLKSEQAPQIVLRINF